MVPNAQSNISALMLIRSRGSHATHVKSNFGMWPGCRYSAKYGDRTVEYELTQGRVTCRRCRHTYNLLVPGERSVMS